MAFSDILSHDREISILKRAVDGDRVAHAYLFAGIEGIGKKMAARELGRALNCEHRKEDGDSCGACQSCLTFDHPGNLNYIEIAPEKGYLKIDPIRELQRAAIYKTDTETRLIVVDGADTMQKAAANAFLKTLEEPTPGTVIVLLSSRPSLLLPTIISRCQRINFSPLPTQSVATLLMRMIDDGALSRDEALSLASFSLGSVSRAVNAMKSGINAVGDGGLNETGEVLRSLLNGTMGTIEMLKLASKLSKDDNLLTTLEMLKSLIRDMVVEGQGAGELVLGRDISKVAGGTGPEPNLGFEELDRIFSVVDRAKRDMMPPRNANKQIALEAVFMELREVSQGAAL
jgi:DNA polymerase-3 subunit delta'